MTGELIRNRIKELNAQIQQLRDNIHAVDGAIQDCEFWLKQITPKEKNGDLSETPATRG
jgi:prefoldin subunit 5